MQPKMRNFKTSSPGSIEENAMFLDSNDKLEAYSTLNRQPTSWTSPICTMRPTVH